jgi:hypothetical protein
MPPLLIDGLPIRTSSIVPRTQPTAYDDAEERFAAMTAHHLDLSLLDLTYPDPVVWMFQGIVLCHPDNLPLVLGLARRAAQRTEDARG